MATTTRTAGEAKGDEEVVVDADPDSDTPNWVAVPSQIAAQLRAGKPRQRN